MGRRPGGRPGGRDPALREAARWGESAVAWARIATGVLFAALGQLSTAPPPVGRVTFALGLGLIAIGYGGLLLLRRGVPAGALAQGTIFLDVSLITAGMVFLVPAAGTEAAANERNLFACYLVVRAATGLRYDPRLDRALRTLLEDSEESPARAAVVLFDVDHFKEFNDRYGHPAGDSALRAVAAVLRHSFRGTDLVARMGGEEFAVLLSGINLQDAVRRVEASRRAVASLRLPDPGKRHGDGRLPPVTVSAGLAFAPEDGASPGCLLRAADSRLCEAKRRGRDRLVGPATMPGPPAAIAAG